MVFDSDSQYAFVFASIHCSPMICSSSAETLWINPSLSGEASADVNEVVDIVRERERGKELSW
jgi:hypothetical protein